MAFLIDLLLLLFGVEDAALPMVEEVDASLLLVKLAGVEGKDAFEDQGRIGLLLQLNMVDVTHHQHSHREGVQPSLVGLVQVSALQQSFQSQYDAT